MPYRHAHYYLLLLYPLTVIAFWPNYFGVLRAAPYAFHVHGITASLWILLLTVQSWSIHQRRNALHKSLGIWSFLLFPLFIVGGLLVIQTMAGKFAAQAGPFFPIFGARLGAVDSLTTAGILYLFYMALKCRRKVHLHARYMLGTVFFLFMPIASRFLQVVPQLSISGPHEMHRFVYTFHLAHLLSAGTALFLAARTPKHGRPLVVVAGFIAMQSAVFETVGRTRAWEAFFTSLAGLPGAAFVAVGLALSFAAIWAGWTAGTRPEVRRRAAA